MKERKKNIQCIEYQLSSHDVSIFLKTAKLPQKRVSLDSISFKKNYSVKR